MPRGAEVRGLEPCSVLGWLAFPLSVQHGNTAKEVLEAPGIETGGSSGQAICSEKTKRLLMVKEVK